jgi:hypothetical protein
MNVEAASVGWAYTICIKTNAPKREGGLTGCYWKRQAISRRQNGKEKSQRSAIVYLLTSGFLCLYLPLPAGFELIRSSVHRSCF